VKPLNFTLKACLKTVYQHLNQQALFIMLKLQRERQSNNLLNPTSLSKGLVGRRKMRGFFWQKRWSLPVIW